LYNPVTTFIVSSKENRNLIKNVSRFSQIFVKISDRKPDVTEIKQVKPNQTRFKFGSLLNEADSVL